MELFIPPELSQAYQNSHERRAWLQSIPARVERACARWNLRLRTDQLPGSGFASVVYPVHTHDGGRAALKVTFPYADNTHEAATLRLWNGSGAVKLLEFDAEDSVHLLQWLDGGRELHSAPMADAVRVWGDVVRKLSIAPDGRSEWSVIPQLHEQARAWATELPAAALLHPDVVPDWLLETAVDICRRYAEGAPAQAPGVPYPGVLVHADLHGMNVLARPGTSGWESEDFLAIDPQGMLGDAEFAIAPMLWNRLADLDSQHPEESLLNRLSALCDAAGLDAELGRQWSLVRNVENVLYYAEKDTDRTKDRQRSLWLASVLAGSPIAGLPRPAELEITGP